jgi:hypothetical protein
MKKILILLLLPLALLGQNQFPGVTKFTGQAGQTATINNIIPATAGSAGTDVLGNTFGSIQIISTGTAGTFIFETANSDANYQTMNVWNNNVLTGTPISAAITATSSNIIYYFPISANFIRVRIATTITGGSIQAITRLTTQSANPITFQVAQATAASLNATVTGTINLGTGGTGATSLGKAEDAVAASGDTGIPIFGVRRDALTTSASAAGDYSETTVNRFGALYFAGFRTAARTYSATANVTVAATATDIAALFGNATTTVQVTKIRVTGIQTTAGLVDISLIKRSTANSGGTSSSMSLAAHDAADAANSSTPISYTANPTPGTSVGTIRRWHQAVGQSTSTVTNEFTLEFGENGKPIILSGTAQGLCLNLNSTTVTGGVFNITIEWIEF